MTRPMTRFDAIPGGRPCGAFRPNDARIEQVASTARACRSDMVSLLRAARSFGAAPPAPGLAAFTLGETDD